MQGAARSVRSIVAHGAGRDAFASSVRVPNHKGLWSGNGENFAIPPFGFGSPVPKSRVYPQSTGIRANFFAIFFEALHTASVFSLCPSPVCSCDNGYTYRNPKVQSGEGTDMQNHAKLKTRQMGGAIIMVSKIILRMEWLFYRLFSKLFKFKTIRSESGDFKLITSTENEVHRAVTFHNKEPETIKWINEFSSIFGKNDFIFFDIGANVGIYSLYAANCYSKAQIFSFEPDSQSFGSLCQNIYINHFKIRPYPFAISDKFGIGNVRLSSMNAGAGACALGGKYQFSNTVDTDIFDQGVFFCSLDELVGQFGFPIPNFIKVDVDGLEAIILCGAETVLRSNDCKGLLVEFQYQKDSDLESTISWLASLGFTLSTKSDWIAGFGPLKSRNFIFKKN